MTHLLSRSARRSSAASSAMPPCRCTSSRSLGSTAGGDQRNAGVAQSPAGAVHRVPVHLQCRYFRHQPFYLLVPYGDTPVFSRLIFIKPLPRYRRRRHDTEFVLCHIGLPLAFCIRPCKPQVFGPQAVPASPEPSSGRFRPAARPSPQPPASAGACVTPGFLPPAAAFSAPSSRASPRSPPHGTPGNGSPAPGAPAHAP